MGLCGEYWETLGLLRFQEKERPSLKNPRTGHPKWFPQVTSGAPGGDASGDSGPNWPSVWLGYPPPWWLLGSSKKSSWSVSDRRHVWWTAPQRCSDTGWAIRLEREKQNGDTGEVLALRSAAALAQGCLQRIQKPHGIALDAADFVRHVPSFSTGLWAAWG